MSNLQSSLKKVGMFWEKKKRLLDTILLVLIFISLCGFVFFVFNYEDINAWSIVSFILLVFFLIIGTFRKSYREDLRAFFDPFIQGKKGVVYGITATIILIVVISILAHFCHLKYIRFFKLAPFILCIVGIYLTSRVYFEIQEDKTVTLADYLKILNYIISSSKKSDKILIIAPTIILGQAHKDKEHKDRNYIYIIDTYFDQILKHLKTGEIFFALLDFDYKNFNDFNVTKSGNEKAIYETHNHSGKIENKPLSNYHFKSFSEYVNDEQGKLDNLMKNALGENLKKLNSSGKANFIRLESRMYIDGNDYDRSHGFFAVANFDKGMYYLGAYEHNERTYNFHGTYFRNEHIKTQMLSMLNTVIDDKIVSETEDEKKKREVFFKDDSGSICK